MKALRLLAMILGFAALCHISAKAQPNRGVAQVAPVPPPPPPPPGPPPDFIDDDTEFDDGDDLPDDYMPPMPPPQGPMAHAPPPNNGQPPYPPNSANDQQQGRPLPFSPPSEPPPSYENDRPRFESSKLHFKVVKDEFYEKGKKRERGKDRSTAGD